MTDAPAHPSNVVVVLLDSLNRHMLGSYGGAEFETPHLDRFARTRRCASPGTSPGRSPACRPDTTSSAARSTSCGGPGDRSSCGRSRSPTTCGALASRPCWCRTTRTCSRRAGRTTTPSSPAGTTCGATRATRGAPGATRPGWVPRPVPPARAAGTGSSSASTSARAGPTTGPAPSSGPRRTSPARGSCGPRPSGSARPRRTTTAASSSSTSSTRTSPSTRPSRGSAATTPTGTTTSSSGRPYDVGAVASGRSSERQARHIRANYGSKLSMIDHWFGEMLAALDEQGAWDDTAVVVTTDHGHYLGEQRGGATSGASPGCCSTSRSGTSRCSSHGPAQPADRPATRSPRASTSSPRWPTCSA